MPPREGETGGIGIVPARLPAEDDEYWDALGEFVETFAMSEIFLLSYLSVAANTDRKIVNAFLGGAHIDRIITALNRIWVLSPPPQKIKEVIEPAINQLLIINNIRNSIVHYPSIPVSETDRLSSNALRVVGQNNIKEYRVSTSLLADMTADLEKVCNHFTFANVVIMNPTIPSDELARRMELLTAAWRYKPHGGRPAIESRRTRRGRITSQSPASQTPTSQS